MKFMVHGEHCCRALLRSGISCSATLKGQGFHVTINRLWVNGQNLASLIDKRL
jgi:hypothetical protein